MTWYKQGLVAVTNNSNAIIGSGTAFIANARVGDGFRGPDGGWYEVTNIASDTAIAIAPNYQGVTAAGGVFSIAPMQGYVKDSADRLRAVTDQLNGVPEGVTQAQAAAAASAASAAASATSATQASALAGDAATSVTAASTSATNAETSATAAATSATAASTSKTNAATSATAAATSATNSSNSATNSASSAAAAAASAAQAAQFPLAGGNLTGALNDAPTQTIASAATTNLAAATSNVVAISGTATITSFGTLASGRRFLRFLGAATLTHNAVSLILPGGMNITTSANDTMEVLSLGGGNWFCLRYSLANGKSVAFAYDRSSILGAVSQASGVPTGALQEYGSNANGEYYKFACGLMICTRTFSYPSISISSSAGNGLFFGADVGTLPFAATFSAVPTVAINVTAPADGLVWFSYAANSSVSNGPPVLPIRSGSGTFAINIKQVATGRWY